MMEDAVVDTTEKKVCCARGCFNICLDISTIHSPKNYPQRLFSRAIS